MKNTTYIIIIIFAIIINFVEFELIKRFGSSNPFSPFKGSITKRYFPLLVLLFLPILSLVIAPVLAVFNSKSIKPFKDKLTPSYLETLILLYLFLVLWMLVAGVS